MKPPTPLLPVKRLLLTVLATALVTTTLLFFVHRGRAREAARLRSENNRLHYEAVVRRPAPALPSPSAAPAATANSAARPVAPLQAPTGDYLEAGHSTPQATLQTFAWACARGDTARVEQMLWFESGAHEKAQAFMATLPETARRNWATPEAMAAALFVADANEHPFPAATILAKATPAVLTADRVLLELPGAGPLREHTEYVKQGDSWRYVITMAAVDAYIARTGTVHR